jgi:hypothetical protein
MLCFYEVIFHCASSIPMGEKHTANKPHGPKTSTMPLRVKADKQLLRVYVTHVSIHTYYLETFWSN